MKLIITILKAMLEYQEKNNITKQCMTNAQYLYDFLINNYPEINPKIKSVIALSEEDDTLILVYGHLVVCLQDDLILEASYEIKSKPNVRYFKTIPQLLKALPGFKMNKEQLTTFINFTNLSNKMNDNSSAYVADEIFYNNQADYVENIVKEKYGNKLN